MSESQANSEQGIIIPQHCAESDFPAAGFARDTHRELLRAIEETIAEGKPAKTPNKSPGPH